MRRFSITQLYALSAEFLRLVIELKLKLKLKLDKIKFSLHY